MSFFLVYTVVWFVGGLVILGLRLFAEYVKLDSLESCFSQNEKVRGTKRFWGRNQPIDRFYRMLQIYEFLSDSKCHLEAGLVTEAELKSIPLSLRRWVLWPFYLTYIWGGATIVWCLWFWWFDIQI